MATKTKDWQIHVKDILKAELKRRNNELCNGRRESFGYGDQGK